MDFEKELKVERTNIPGLIVFDLPVHGDNRGWFQGELAAREDDRAAPARFRPVQNNISFNAKKGVTRGIHAEPWDKYIGIATGAVFGAWSTCARARASARCTPPASTRPRRSTCRAAWQQHPGARRRHRVHVPRQRHWSLEQKKTYTFVNLAYPELDIQWPIPLEESERSEADPPPDAQGAPPMARAARWSPAATASSATPSATTWRSTAWRASSSTTSTRSTSPTRPSTTGSTGACTARS